VPPTKEADTVTQTLTTSLTLVSLLLVLPQGALAQSTPTPVPASPPTAGSAAPPPSAAPPVAPPPPAVTAPSSPPGPPPTAPPPPPQVDPAPPVVAQSGAPVEFTSLRLMRDKGVISPGEYESAVHDLAETSGMRAPDEGTLVVSKWATTLYGFVEDDNIYDTTRSFNDSAGNALVARANTQAGENGRFTMGVRNSRIGFRMAAPELSGGIRTSAQLEMDFLGTQLPVGSVQPYQGTEAAYFTNPTFRVRHANFKIETPIVDFLVGQYWQLFGWGSAYQPNSVEIQGLPGEVYARTPQVRISKTLKANPVTFEIAVAAVRPVQRDSAMPDGEGGLRLALDSWTGVQTVGATGTQIAPLSIAATGLIRHVAVDNYAAKPTYTNDLGMSAFAVDGFVPVIPGTKHRKDNSLSLNGEFATGYGFADMYTGLTGGITFPALPNPMAAATPPTYTPDIDNGIVTYDSKGGLHGIQWTSYLLGLQYYLPGVDGRIWVSGNFSHMSSANSHFYGAAAATLASEDWFDANLFFAPTPAIRVGVEYANFNNQYVDGQHAINHRGQLSGFFVF
jgi:hypothetical protein